MNYEDTNRTLQPDCWLTIGKVTMDDVMYRSMYRAMDEVNDRLYRHWCYKNYNSFSNKLKRLLVALRLC